MKHVSFTVMTLTLSSLALGACDGGGPSVAMIPPPPPPPPPVSDSPPPVPQGAIGLQSDAPFATEASYLTGGIVTAGNDLVQLSYDASTDKYTITLPDYGAGQLQTLSGNGSYDPATHSWISLDSTYNSVTKPAGGTDKDAFVSIDWPANSPYKYTSLGSWSLTGGNNFGYFAYGIPTAPGDVPLAGVATYAGTVRGETDTGGFVGGTVSLSFDFGAGALDGVMKPILSDLWDQYPLDDYTFRDTSFGKGSTTFSGSFSVAGAAAPSSFNGRFTGPQAAELMANWTAPYTWPGTTVSGTMSGVWIAKRP